MFAGIEIGGIQADCPDTGDGIAGVVGKGRAIGSEGSAIVAVSKVAFGEISYADRCSRGMATANIVVARYDQGREGQCRQSFGEPGVIVRFAILGEISREDRKVKIGGC